MDQSGEIARRLELKINADKCTLMILGKQKTDKLIRMKNTVLEAKNNYNTCGHTNRQKIEFLNPCERAQRESAKEGQSVEIYRGHKMGRSPNNSQYSIQKLHQKQNGLRINNLFQRT
jgi:proline racemase